tara:strand:+ start:1702 stop:2673 length:972 start_codon:yes stop_codon:yes gene_type:complete
MNNILKSNIRNLFLKTGINSVFFKNEINDGINSKIFLYANNREKFVVKLYKNIHRLKREKLFYKFLKINNLKFTPKLLSTDLKNKLIIFSFIKGKKVNKISNNDLDKLILFIRSLNLAKLKNLPLAIDGIKNRKNYLSLCQKKINDLKYINNRKFSNKALIKFLNQTLLPRFEIIKKNLREKKFRKYLKIIENKYLIVSPSDIGFHNILKYKNDLYFYDFEYAGLDDPIKLICDFISQPDQQLSKSQKNKFINNKLFHKHNIKDIKFLVKIFLPLHRIKWCCIMLNEFKIIKKNNIYLTLTKRLYLKKQIDKTIKYYYKHFKK